MTVERSSESPDAVDDMQPLGVTVWGLERPEFGDDVVGDLVFVHLDDGEQMLVRFRNGYGASVVRRTWMRGFAEGFFELAVLRYVDSGRDATGHRMIDFTSQIGHGVHEHLTKADVARLCREIAALERPAGPILIPTDPESP